MTAVRPVRPLAALCATVCLPPCVPAVAAQSVPALSPAVREYVAVDAPAVALVGVRVIDGTGAAPWDGQTVLLRDGRIEAVGPASSIDVPADVEARDLAGHTVIPGLVGLHDHLFYTAAGGRRVELTYSAPRLYLGSGVTTVRTTGSTAPYADISLRDDIERGVVPGPRIHVTAPYISGPSDPSPFRAKLASPEEARRFVAYWAEEGATWIKAYMHIGRAELGAAIEEAHRLGLGVTGHLCSVTFREAVDLGIDNLEHGLLTASDFSADKEPDACPPTAFRAAADADPAGETARAVIDHMVEGGVALSSTLAVFEPFFPGRPTKDERTLEAMAPEVREAYLAARARIDSIGDLDVQALRSAMAFEKAFHDAGGLLAAGVDPTGIGGALPGFGDQRNYELLIEAGFAPAEAVRVMTLNGAKVLGVDGELGSVEAGKRADLVVLEGDLAADPSAIRNVTLVFKDGVGYDSPALIESVTGRVGIN